MIASNHVVEVGSFVSSMRLPKDDEVKVPARIAIGGNHLSVPKPVVRERECEHITKPWPLTPFSHGTYVPIARDRDYRFRPKAGVPVSERR